MLHVIFSYRRMGLLGICRHEEQFVIVSEKRQKENNVNFTD